MYKVLGVSELDILVPDSRLAELKMQEAHDQDHKGAKITLWRSRADLDLERHEVSRESRKGVCSLYRTKNHADGAAYG